MNTINPILQKRIKAESNKYMEEAIEMNSAVGDNLHHEDLKTCFIEAADFALQNQWIPVEEALPESIAQRVLIVNHHFPFDVYFGRYEYGKWIIEGESEDLWITHWAEIPSLEGGEE